MADEYEFKSSLEQHSNDFMFEKKEFIKLPDSNQGTYPASQIVFNLPSIANNDMYQALKESYLEIPYVLTLSAGTAFDTVAKQAYAC